jgi:hypothetical protein
MIADDMYSKLTWGNRCDALEAALLDAEAAWCTLPKNSKS